MGQQRKMEKKNKIKTSGTERCENIDSLYMNKKYDFKQPIKPSDIG